MAEEHNNKLSLKTLDKRQLKPAPTGCISTEGASADDKPPC